jgi:uncharacterized protein (TIGR02466 family)
MEQQGKIQQKLHFGVPIYEVGVPGFADHRESLKSHFLEMREAEAGVSVSNQGGWHSKSDLHHSKEPSVHWLMQHIAVVGNRCIRHGQTVPDDSKLMLASAWVNINEAGDWNAPHAHFPCHWSGVVYIDLNSGEADVTKGGMDGNIMFFDPLPLGPQYQRPPTITKTPDVGRMFIFPAYIVHMVAPHFDNGPRISVAFNFNMVAKNA